MNILGPERYSLSITPDSYTVTCARGTSKFSGLATTRKPKLYIVAVDGKPIYVGMTKQKISSRFRFGWKAKGESG